MVTYRLVIFRKQYFTFDNVVVVNLRTLRRKHERLECDVCVCFIFINKVFS